VVSVQKRANRVTNEQSGAIPPDFSKTTAPILLCVLQNNKKYDQTLKEHVMAEYRGKYE
jgi:hypothetical protein